MQVEIAIDEADCIVFVVSGKDGLTHDDEYVARLLHKTKKPVILAVNKVDDFAQNDAIYEFYSLGLGIRWQYPVRMVSVSVMYWMQLSTLYRKKRKTNMTA